MVGFGFRDVEPMGSVLELSVLLKYLSPTHFSPNDFGIWQCYWDPSVPHFLAYPLNNHIKH